MQCATEMLAREQCRSHPSSIIADTDAAHSSRGQAKASRHNTESPGKDNREHARAAAVDVPVVVVVPRTRYRRSRCGGSAVEASRSRRRRRSANTDAHTAVDASRSRRRRVMRRGTRGGANLKKTAA